MKAALFRKQQEYKKEKSSPITGLSTSTAAAAQDAAERAGRKVSDKVSTAKVHITHTIHTHTYIYSNTHTHPCLTTQINYSRWTTFIFKLVEACVSAISVIYIYMRVIYISMYACG